MQFSFETQEDPRSRQATELYAWCCRHDDKSPYQYDLKFEEEKGEFFREYLIWDANLSGVRAMSHRTTTREKIHEEMIDCLITLARVKDWSEFFYAPSGRHDVIINPYGHFATALKSQAFLHALEAASDSMTADEFYEFLLKKLNKWERILIATGLDKIEGTTLAPTTSTEAPSC
jgi:hypothetical protein